ncbi:efflux RND transporter periplasmic adaptor subunit [Cyclobacterium jeungdonense]|uniref:Efflux RND transporter periplasmic adaptor subunit n=1 Tax=Cyclobacterium jeungdonense TaxID=708087 RepID=A0ABT8C9J1_9BACT|nr:efflux RND transporter periplasmic adaptor subunit [Cyclobacterium jeungdonense]MDN3689156.1 efflux RND transporter periplasmic adaptor subunit [Cyclobacterium jeungdonense]
MRCTYFVCSLFSINAIFFSCSEPEESNEEIPMETFRDEVQATTVRVSQSESKSFDYLINATGKIEAANEVMVIVERPGYLIELEVEEGQKVRAGQTLARLDKTDSQMEWERAQVELRSAMAEYQSRRIAADVETTLLDSLGNSERDEFWKASSGLLSAQIAVREAERNLEKTDIKAPISGAIADLQLKKGSLVNAGDEVCLLLSTNLLEMKVKILESDISFIRKGQNAEVYPVSGSGEGISGTVSSINPKVDENGLVQVTLDLQQSGNLLPGMNARAVIRSPQNNSLVVPKEAVVYRSGRPVVFTIDNNEAIWNYVEVGKDNGREMEILDGLEASQPVIISNNVQLAHQAPVQVITE